MMEVKRVEQRACPRSRMTLRAEVRLTCGVIVDGAALDISLNGLLLETERILPLDCPVKVTLVHEGEHGELCLECRGTVSRIDPRGVAIVFDEMHAETSVRLQHLLQMEDVPAESTTLSAGFSGEYY